MSNTAKGRWMGAVTLGIVTVTWMVVVGSEGAGAFLAAGLLVGCPYALATGTVLGAIAGRLAHHRELVLATLAVTAVLVLDALPCLLLTGNEWSSDPMIPKLCVLSLVPSIAAALWLERWTRPVPAVATATARQTR